MFINKFVFYQRFQGIQGNLIIAYTILNAFLRIGTMQIMIPDEIQPPESFGSVQYPGDVFCVDLFI